MKHYLLLSFLILFSLTLHAQTPQYYVNSTGGANTYPFNNTSGNKVAWLYLPSDFGTPPAGTITKIYFTPGSSASNATYNNFTIKMGLTTQTAWTSSTYPTTGLTTVVAGNPFVIPTVAAPWVGINLTTPLVFDGTSSIIVLVESQSYSNGFNVYQNSTTGRRIYGTYGSANGVGFDGTYSGFGFDIVTCPSPVISSQPQNRNVCEGATTAFSVTASNTSFYQWQVNTGSGFSNVSNNSIYGGATTSTLTLSQVPASMNNYLYRCVLTGACNNPINSGTATLNIMPGATITKHTIADSICETASTALDVFAVGTISGYQWQMAVATVGIFNDVPAQYPYNGTTSSTLDILSAHDTMNGYLYRCIVLSPGTCSGATTAPIPLTVLTPPNINTGGPVNASVYPNSDVSFNITVTGQNYEHYWQASDDGITFANINNGPIYQNVKTGTLTVKSASMAQNKYWFRCIIKSTDPACGIFHDTSDAAQLTIIGPDNINDLSAGGINLSVSPNPASGSQLFLRNDGKGSGEVNVSVMDNIGKTVLNTSARLLPNTATPVNIASLAPGLYMLRVWGDNREIINTKFTRQ